MSTKLQRIVDPVLTTLARGYANAELVAIYLFPVVFLPKEGARVPRFGKEAFKIHNTERAIRANSNRISPNDLDSIPVNFKEHDLEYPVDYREEAESILSKQKHATAVVSDGIALRHEKMAADLAQDPANYASSNKIALTTTGCWDDYTNSDPIAAVETGKEAVRAKIAKMPNTMIIGPVTYKILKSHPKILDRIKYSMKGIVTVELLQEIFGIKRVIVGNAVYSNDAGTAFSDIWGDTCVLAYVSETPDEARTEYDASFGYTFKKSGYPQVDTYPETGGKVDIVRSTDFFNPMIVGAEAGYLITNTKA